MSAIHDCYVILKLIFIKPGCNSMSNERTLKYKNPRHIQRSHNLGKFPQIFAVSMGVVLGIMRILCIPFKSLLFGNCSANSQPPSPSRNNDMEISCESAGHISNYSTTSTRFGAKSSTCKTGLIVTVIITKRRSKNIGLFKSIVCCWLYTAGAYDFYQKLF